MEAVRSLAKRRDEQAIELLASALKDEDVDVLYTTASALAQVGVSSAVAPLIRLALDEEQHVMRRAASVFALSWLCYPTEDVRATLDWIAKRGDPWLQSLARTNLR
jgi:HEAT repeat protein